MNSFKIHIDHECAIQRFCVEGQPKIVSLLQGPVIWAELPMFELWFDI